MKLGGTISKLGPFAGEVRKQMRAAMVETATDYFRQTQERVPVRSGDLKSTGRVSVRVGDKQVMARILYGDRTKVRYAVIVHERVGAAFRSGQAKYVESVVAGKGREFTERLAKRLDVARAARRAA